MTELHLTLMKKIFFLLTLCLLALPARAQGRFSFSLEIAAGAGFGHGPQFTVTPLFASQYDLGGGFRIGAGAGIRFAKPCLQHITQRGNSRRNFCNEFDIPVFLRLSYGIKTFFASVDTGYSIGILSYYGPDWIPGGKKAPSYNGFFAEPQIGLTLGRHSALALGVLLQQSLVDEKIHTEVGKMGDPNYSSSTTSFSKRLLTPAVTIRYAFRF